MNIAIIVAGGSGTRMTTSKVPKQFLKLKDKQIIIHTVEKFYFNDKVDKIIIACHNEWIDHLKQLIINYKYQDKVYICSAGSSRNETVLCGLNYGLKNDLIKKGDIILTHDAVRMFISSEIINKNIEECNEQFCINTVMPATDTIVISKEFPIIDSIPNRDFLFHGQTPQTFSANTLINIYKNQLNYDNFNSTDVCKLAELNNYKIKMVIGDKENFKITTEFDLKIAEIMVNND